jgi:ABC-type protease/lipase transport system fused ATPase/permease subunit
MRKLIKYSILAVWAIPYLLICWIVQSWLGIKILLSILLILIECIDNLHEYLSNRETAWCDSRGILVDFWEGFLEPLQELILIFRQI